jgi:hypothetical protein
MVLGMGLSFLAALRLWVAWCIFLLACLLTGGILHCRARLGQVVRFN